MQQHAEPSAGYTTPFDGASAFDASPNAYMILTPSLHYAGMNQAYLDVMQRTREELLGRHVFDAFDGGPADESSENARQLRASFEKVLVTGQADHLAVIHYAIPVPGQDGATTFEDRYWSCAHTPIKNADGEVTHILQYAADITELETLRRSRSVEQGEATTNALDIMLGGDLFRRALDVQATNRQLESERNRLVEMFMQTPGFVAVLSGPNHEFQLFNEAYRRLTNHRALAGLTVAQALPEVEAQGYIDMLDSVLETGEPVEGRASPLRLQLPDGHVQDVYVDFIYQPIRDADGRNVGVFVQGHDVTATVLAAQRQKLMIDELNHRVKNTLATVQSIAMQTARSHEDPTTFAEGFQARLIALSHTHDLLTRSHWQGADLHDVLHHETEAHGAQRVVLNGPPVALGPAAALSFGMIFHELATNAAKYGALSSGDGRVFVDWSLANHLDRRLKLFWREQGGPAVTEPTRRGFGSRLIERNVRHDLAGDVKLSYPTIGFNAEISIPLDRDNA